MTNPLGGAPPRRPLPAGGPSSIAVEARDPTESVGRYLSRQRRLRGITIEELSEITRIPVRSLERLEGGRFDGVADGFVRGFVRTVGEALGLDADDTVSRLLSEVRIDPEAGGPRVSLERTAIAVGAVLVFAALLGLGSWLVGGSNVPGSDPSRVVYRQDPVRALADAVSAQGIPVPAGDPAAPLAPPAPPEATRTAEAAPAQTPPPASD